MVEMDGSYGEGGGQILRTALALSVLTGAPVRIYNIRAGRKSPGLKPQHLMSAQAAARICRGRLVGAELGATELGFYPGRVQPGLYPFDVGTLAASAGSTSLIFQTLLWPLVFAAGPSHLILKGGTHVAWSPPADYLCEVFLPAVAPMGIQAKISIRQRGFYPRGGGELDGTLEPLRTSLRPLRVEERGELKRLEVLSQVANLPLEIARRQLNRTMVRLTERGLKAQGETQVVGSSGKGTFCFILAEFERIRAGFSALGEIGKRAEQVADEAVEAFFRFFEGAGALDCHLSDQVLLGLALAEGESAVTVSEVTHHLKTNLWVVEQFLPVRFILKENPGGGGSLRVVGIGYRGDQRL